MCTLNVQKKYSSTFLPIRAFSSIVHKVFAKLLGCEIFRGVLVHNKIFAKLVCSVQIVVLHINLCRKNCSYTIYYHVVYEKCMLEKEMNKVFQLSKDVMLLGSAYLRTNFISRK